MKTTLSRLLAPVALACVAGAGLSVPAVAKDEPIVVQSQAALEEWTAEVSRDLSRNLRPGTSYSTFQPKSGIVQVSFTLNENGRAENFAFLSSSGNARTDGLAKHAVRQLRDLDEAPVQDVFEQTFLANIIFADSPAQRDQLIDQLAESERARLASGGEARTYLAISM